MRTSETQKKKQRKAASTEEKLERDNKSTWNSERISNICCVVCLAKSTVHTVGVMLKKTIASSIKNQY
jgi:hypothetical protein